MRLCLLSVKSGPFWSEPSLIVVRLMHVSLRLLMIIGSISVFAKIFDLIPRDHTVLIDGDGIMLEVTALFVIGLILLGHL